MSLGCYAAIIQERYLTFLEISFVSYIMVIRATIVVLEERPQDPLQAGPG